MKKENESSMVEIGYASSVFLLGALFGFAFGELPPVREIIRLQEEKARQHDLLCTEQPALDECQPIESIPSFNW